MATVEQLLARVRRLDPEVPRREAVLLLGEALGIDEASVWARGERVVEVVLEARFWSWIERRQAGEPVAYILGEREFYGRRFAVDDRVLVPRPETEHLIEAVLALDLPAAARLADIGTGSGCIGVTLACQLPHSSVVMTDLSCGALEVAGANARHHGVRDRVGLARADGVEGLRLEAFDVVASNPPYIAPALAAVLDRDVVDFEPHLALFAADRGRAMLLALIEAAARQLHPGAHLVLEIGHDQGDWLTAAIANRSALRLVDLIADYAGHPRTAVIRRL